MLVHWVWFHLLPGMTGRQKLALLEQYTPEDLYNQDLHGAVPEEIRHCLRDKDLTAARHLMKSCSDKGMGILALTDTGYPARLRTIDEPPLLLFYLGTVPALEEQPVIGIVGTRRATSYGLRSAGKMGAQIAACGGIVVSGGAMGIDSVALRGALETGGTTMAFMAGGLDKLYPSSNSQLFRKILEKGCIFSEYLPGEPCYKGNFLRRNRLISGISNGLLVVEAPKISGALNTARWASEQGRDVFVVPGNIDVESCAGSNALIGDIARPALDGWSIMSEYAHAYPNTVKKQEVDFRLQIPETPETPAPKPVPKEKADKKTIDKQPDCSYSVKDKPTPSLNPQEQAVVALLGNTPVSMDFLLSQLDTAPAGLMTLLTRLSVRGVVELHPGKFVSLKHGG